MGLGVKRMLLLGPALACAPCLAWAATPTDQPSGASAPQAVTEVVVTARRKAEALSTTPVAITAFSAQKITEANVHSTQDLQKFTPGVVFGDTGSPSNATFTIRGQGRFVIGGALPAVLSYSNEVPLGNWAAGLPTFDISNVQVLKGPQGTLFGRNTTGGAVLAYSQAPKYEYGGYAELLYGSLNWVDGQFAINVPIIEDKLAVRVAGNFERRDGDTKNIGVGGDQGDVHNDAVRVSILFEPTSYIKNTLVLDDYFTHTNDRAVLPNGVFSAPDGTRQYQAVATQYAGLDYVFGTNSGGWPLCTANLPSCNVDAALKQQAANGPRVTNNPRPFPSKLRVQGVANTTTVQLGGIQFKNIFGFRQDAEYDANHTDGLPFILEDVTTERANEQFSEEFQLSGDLFEKKVEWLLGGFYFTNKNPGPTELAFDAYRNPTWYPTPSSPTPNILSVNPVPGIPVGTPLSALLGPYNPGSAQQVAFFSDQSRALFGQTIYHFSGPLDGLSLTLGLRYTADGQQACSKFVQPIDAAPINGVDACRALGGPSTPAAQRTSIGRTDSHALTWQAGLDYKLNKNVFLYVVGRKGYRGGGLNTPQLGGLLTAYQSYRPQDVTDVEIGAKTHWRVNDWSGSFDIAAFNSDYTNLQRAVTGLPTNLDGDNNPADDPSNTSIYINTKTANAKGVEVDGTVSPNSDLTFTYALSYLDYQIDSSPAPAVFTGVVISSIENAPKWSYTLGADYRLPIDTGGLGQFYVHGDYYWIDDYFVGVTKLGSHGIANFNIDWRNIGGRPLTASFFVQNATDKVYAVSSTLSGTAPGFETVGYGPPRLFGIRFRYKFGAG